MTSFMVTSIQRHTPCCGFLKISFSIGTPQISLLKNIKNIRLAKFIGSARKDTMKSGRCQIFSLGALVVCFLHFTFLFTVVLLGGNRMMQDRKAKPRDQLIEKELEKKDVRLQLVLGIFRGIISAKDNHGGCYTMPVPLHEFAKKSH